MDNLDQIPLIEENDYISYLLNTPEKSSRETKINSEIKHPDSPISEDLSIELKEDSLINALPLFTQSYQNECYCEFCSPSSAKKICRRESMESPSDYGSTNSSSPISHPELAYFPRPFDFQDACIHDEQVQCFNVYPIHEEVHEFSINPHQFNSMLGSITNQNQDDIWDRSELEETSGMNSLEDPQPPSQETNFELPRNPVPTSAKKPKVKKSNKNKYEAVKIRNLPKFYIRTFNKYVAKNKSSLAEHFAQFFYPEEAIKQIFEECEKLKKEERTPASQSRKSSFSTDCSHEYSDEESIGTYKRQRDGRNVNEKKGKKKEKRNAKEYQKKYLNNILNQASPYFFILKQALLDRIIQMNEGNFGKIRDKQLYTEAIGKFYNQHFQTKPNQPPQYSYNVQNLINLSFFS